MEHKRRKIHTFNLDKRFGSIYNRANKSQEIRNARETKIKFMATVYK